MPKDPPVVLNYDPKADTPFGPTPRQVAVGPNDRIRFKIGDSTRASQPNCKLRITLHEDKHFSKRVVEHSKGNTGAEELVLEVRAKSHDDLVASAVNNIITAYDCQLLDAAGTPIPGLSSIGGGEIVPDSGP
jgi:hypothetical protein